MSPAADAVRSGAHRHIYTLGMNHPQSPWLARVAALMAVALTTLAGCTPAPQPAGSPSPSSAPVTAQGLAALTEQEFGVGFAAYADASIKDATTGVVVHAATPGVPEWRVSLAFGPGPDWATGETTCFWENERVVKCVERDGVRLAWNPGGTVYVASARAGGVAVASLAGDDPAPKTPPTGDLSESVRKLIALAQDPRLGTTATPQAPATSWRDDPDCAAAPRAELLPVTPATGQPTEQVTPQALAALLAERIQGTCAAGTSSRTEATVSGTVYLGSADGEKVTAQVRPETYGCKGMDACERRGELTISWQFDLPEEYPAKVRITRPIPGGQLEITHTSHHANAKTKAFPVPLDTLVKLASDKRFGLMVDPALNRAGAELPLCWLLTPRTGG